MSDVKYNLNIGVAIQRLLTSFEKYNAFNIYWLRAILYPLQELQYGFADFTVRARLDAYANSQKLLLQANLNKRFDIVQQRISIINNSLNNSNAATNFTVQIPQGVAADAVAKFVEKYVLFDRTFDIVTV